MFKVKKFYVCHSNYCVGRLWISHKEDTYKNISDYAKWYREEFNDACKGYYINLCVNVKVFGITIKQIVECIEWWGE